MLFRSGQFDLGFATLRAHKPSHVVRPFIKNQAVCVLPKTHRLTQKKTVHAKDLDGEPFISLSLQSPFRMSIDDLFNKTGIRRKISVETGTQLAICNLVAAGVGVSIVDPLVAKAMSEKLVIRPFRPVIFWSLAVLIPSQESMSLVAKKFVDWVEQYFKLETIQTRG